MHAGQEAVSDSAHTIVNCLIDLIQYPHMMVIEIFWRRISIFGYLSCALKYGLLFYEVAFCLGSISLCPLPPDTPSPQPKEKGKKPTITIISYPPNMTVFLFICKYGLLLCLLQLSQLLVFSSSLLDYIGNSTGGKCIAAALLVRSTLLHTLVD